MLTRNFDPYEGFRQAYSRPGPFTAIPSICNQRSLHIHTRDWSPKFETGLNIIISIVQKVFSPFAKMIPLWVHHFDRRIGWSTMPIMIFSPVSNFGGQSLYYGNWATGYRLCSLCKGGFLSGSVICFSFQISKSKKKRNIPKKYPELEI